MQVTGCCIDSAAPKYSTHDALQMCASAAPNQYLAQQGTCSVCQYFSKTSIHSHSEKSTRNWPRRSARVFSQCLTRPPAGTFGPYFFLKPFQISLIASSASLSGACVTSAQVQLCCTASTRGTLRARRRRGPISLCLFGRALAQMRLPRSKFVITPGRKKKLCH